MEKYKRVVMMTVKRVSREGRLYFYPVEKISNEETLVDFV